ncbi:MAG TPA: hypothetical protein VIJ61_14795, partial [Thermoanaerobaculia bacterium]
MASTPDPVSVYPDPDPNGEARPPEENFERFHLGERSRCILSHTGGFRSTTFLILGEKIMGSTPNPVSVYPDPDGKSNANTAPSDTRLTGGAIATAGGSAVTLAIGSGTVPDPTLLFFQATGHGGGG